MKWIALLLFCFVCSAVSASDHIPWHGKEFFMITKGMKLSSLLKAFGTNYDVPVTVDPAIDDSFMGKIEGTTPQKTLERLSRSFNLAYYYDGASLHFYKSRQIEHKIISPKYVQATKIAQYLHKVGIASSKFCSFKKIPRVNALEISGVPVCVSRTSQLAQSLDQKILEQAQNKEAIRVFPLKFASASDNVYSYRGQKVTVPGVVSVLKSMAQGQAIPISSDGKQTNASNSTLPVFSSDPRQNAIVVRGRQANMPLYHELIEQLDKKQTQIQVSVEIIDVDAGGLNSLGIDWSASAKIGGGRVNFNTDTGAGDGTFSTVVNDTGNFLLKLNALEKHSKAKVLSRPSIVTLNNAQAILDRNITFYTKVSGEKVANLESVTTGSLLRVTPRLVDDSGSQKILLTLNIQDGRQIPQKTSNLPQVQNSQIATQATLKPGQSLLLGGFVQDEDTEVDSKIPLLGDIPILGYLFRNKDHSKNSVIRLFLIKASPISLG
ncbi:EscC/YscC/HrcC family type III secretion system outer membrane ring protein [Vibrio sp. S4M6]|uniref:EscC/YscC/HrcC family type III secretion system outer membrane ring protein n=1 Tax=Vibrio sinus TaxID=2946865 RepID=UPI00202A27D9|nr:EscC/YscC/HrcC family type III secretion system outer membrane ring protein [Vibrio sinus]MCL9783724.1 EscC/YscC/HrcC family type III secretion system outer membrane ring protein [Vibrio sinus]